MDKTTATLRQIKADDDCRVFVIEGVIETKSGWELGLDNGRMFTISDCADFTPQPGMKITLYGDRDNPRGVVIDGKILFYQPE